MMREAVIWEWIVRREEVRVAAEGDVTVTTNRHHWHFGMFVIV